MAFPLKYHVPPRYAIGHFYQSDKTVLSFKCPLRSGTSALNLEELANSPFISGSEDPANALGSNDRFEKAVGSF